MWNLKKQVSMQRHMQQSICHRNGTNVNESGPNVLDRKNTKLDQIAEMRTMHAAPNRQINYV